MYLSEESYSKVLNILVTVYMKKHWSGGEVIKKLSSELESQFLYLGRLSL